MSQFIPQNTHETEFYQWVFENCIYKLYHIPNNKTDKPFASYNVYLAWWIKQCQK
jgi:hypothetical protein